MIHTQDLGFAVGARALLHDCTMAFPTASLTAVLGPNGAGKSTLLRLVAGDLVPSAGAITLDARPLAAWPLASLARRRAVVTQFNHLAFPFTCAEVVSLGRAPHRRHETRRQHQQAVSAAMQRMDVFALRDRIFTSLSGGEQQRVTVARALAQLEVEEPVDGQRYLLLDEPTASLDLAHQYQLMECLRELAREGVTVIVILHDLNLALTYADRVAVLKRGALAALGETRATLTASLVQGVFEVAVSAVPTTRGHALVFAHAHSQQEH